MTLLDQLKEKIEAEESREESEAAQVAAAILIQRVWRVRSNRAKIEHLGSKERWDDALRNIQLVAHREAANSGRNDPKTRWRRAAFLVGQLKLKDGVLKDEGKEEVGAEDKHLETQHWLELVDGKHRYGSNLKWYHKRWMEDDTNENFFRWLDIGGGKDLSLDQCSRQQLEKERILYLSAEQRLNYLVKINEQGKLLWAKNNQPVDTTPGRWKDLANGEGIVPQDMPTARFPRSKRPSLRSSSIASGSTSSNQANAATHYAGGSRAKHRWTRFFKRRFTPHGIFERLLRKTVRRNTWIYVSDTNFNIFIGIKETGAFQHSSFTSGGIVTSAGLITVKEGVIHTLSPLSGHYRTSVNHFHKFIEVLTDRGVDMSKVQISKAEAALWGIEHLAKFKKAQGQAMGSGKAKVKRAAAGLWKKDEKDTKSGQSTDKPESS